MNNHTLKILSTVALISTIAALFIIKNSERFGYELSIYSFTSPLIWFFLSISIGIGIAIIISQTFNNDCEITHWFFIGLFLILLNNLIILLLPILKGYFFSDRADCQIHWGIVRDIISTGHTFNENFYPITHILLTQVTQISGIDTRVVMMGIPSVFSTLYVIWMYLLNRIIFHEKEYVFLSTLLSTVFLLGSYHYKAYPNSFSLLVIPLTIYLYFKLNEVKQTEYSILFIILLILYPFFHILSTVYLFFMLIAIEFSRVVYERYLYPKNEREYAASIFQLIRNVQLKHALILFITSTSWISSFMIFGTSIRRIASFIEGEIFTTALSDLQRILDTSNLDSFEVIELFLKLYGANIVFGILSMIAVAYIGWKVIIKRSDIPSENLKFKNQFIISTIFLTITLLSISIFLLPIVGVDYFRPWRHVSIILPILSGYTLYKLLTKLQLRITFLITVFAILTLSMSGILNIYPSQYLMMPNQQTTYEEMIGIKWFNEYGNSDIELMYLGVDVHKFGCTLFGYKKCIENKLTMKSIPDHFGYDHNSTVAKILSSNVTYIPISRYDKLLYAGKREKLGRFTPSDFEKLNHDPTVSRLYTNGELEVYFVRATKPT